MSSEALVRVGSFVLILVIMGVAETLFPRRQLDGPKTVRWRNNLSVAVLSSVAIRLLLPVLPAALALYCSEKGYGLFNLLDVSVWVSFPLSIILLDMIIYWQHVAFHRQRLLWRVHRMHHADTNIDASTGVRFHPIEIGGSMLIKLAAVALLGPPATAVIVFEIVLNGCALFNHANVRLPLRLDRVLRLFVVTPDMHRVHHSTDMREANMNYGFNFPWWDRMFATYKAQPDKGHDGMRIGLNIFREPEFGRFTKMLSIPFM